MCGCKALIDSAMKLTFRYGGLDAKGVVITSLVVAAMGGGVAWLFATSAGAYYLAAWVSAVCLAIVALCGLSIPTRIILSDTTLELRCLVDTTYIALESIADVEFVGSEGFRRKAPLVASCGFMGYLGRYIDLRTGRVHRLYASNRKKGVAIHTSKRRYLVSCNNPELLVVALNEARKLAAQE